MESNKSISNLENFLDAAAKLHLESSASLSEECQRAMAETLPAESNLDLFAYEFMAFLGAIILHEAHSKKRREAKEEIDLTYQTLKQCLLSAAKDNPKQLRYTRLFDDQEFHQLLACHYNGQLVGFQFPQDELQQAATIYGLEIPTVPGIDTIFFALLVRLFRVLGLANMDNLSEQNKAGANLTRSVETGISNFGLELQKIT